MTYSLYRCFLICLLIHSTLAISGTEKNTTLDDLNYDALRILISYLPSRDILSLRATSHKFKALTTNHLLPYIRLAAYYFGEHEVQYRKNIQNKYIPLIPGIWCPDPLLRLAYWRWNSNQYIRSHSMDKCYPKTGQAIPLNGWTVISSIQLRDGRLATKSCDTSIIIWDLTSPAIQPSAILNRHSASSPTIIQLHDDRLVSAVPDETLVWDMTKPEGSRCLFRIVTPESFIPHSVLSDGRLVWISPHNRAYA